MQRQRVRHRGGGHAGDRLGPLDEGAEEPRPARTIGIRPGRQIDIRGGDARRVEADASGGQFAEAADHQAGAADQHQSEGDFNCNEELPAADTRAARAPSPALQRAAQVGT